MKRHELIEKIKNRKNYINVNFNLNRMDKDKLQELYNDLYHYDILEEMAAWEADDLDDVLEADKDVVVSFNANLYSKDSERMEEVFITSNVKWKGGATVKDMIDLCVSNYIEENFHHSNTELQNAWNIVIKDVKDVDLLRLRMKHAKLQYKLLEDDININTNDGECVVDYMMTEIVKVWKKYTRVRLITELGGDSSKGYSILDIMKWAEDKGTVSAYALNALNDCVKYVVSDHMELQLVFKINNDHCYGVLDKELKNMVARTKKLELNTQVFQYGYGKSYTYVEQDNLNIATCQVKMEPIQEEIIYVRCRDLSPLAKQLAKDTGYMIEYGAYNKSILEKFQHPITKKIIVAAPNYFERKQIADKMFAETNYINFRWMNQSYAALAKSMVELELGAIPKSSYGPDLEHILREYPLKPYVVKIDSFLNEVQNKNEIRTGQAVTFDCCRQHTSFLLNNTVPYNVFNIFDDAMVFDGELVPGEYILDADVWIGNRTIFVSRVQPLVMIKYLLEKSYITVGNIQYVIKASRTLPANTFKSVVEKWIAKFPYYKHLVNHFIGTLNTQNDIQYKVGMTDSFDVALATQQYYNGDLKLSKVGDIWLLRLQQKTTLLNGSCPIWRHIIAMELIQLDTMRSVVCDENTTILGYNTDSITVLNPRSDIPIKDKSNAMPGDIVREFGKTLRGSLCDLETPEYIYQPLEWKPMTRQELLDSGESAMVCGMPGSCKSSLLKLLNEDDLHNGLKVAVLGFTNMTVANINKTDQFGKGANAHTLDSFFMKEDSRSNWIKKINNLDVIQLDEMSMVPKEKITLLYEGFKVQNELKVRFFGDPNQCKSVETDGIHCNYLKSKAVKLMCNQIIVNLEYQGHRYDHQLYEHLVHLLHTKTLKDEWKAKTLLECDFNICMYNKTRQLINEQCLARWKLTNAVSVVNDMEIGVGLPLICKVNLKQFNIFNSERYYVASFRNSMVTLGDKVIESNYINSTNFNYGFAENIYRVQGCTLPQSYNILEFQQMSFNNIYTAISRGISMDKIGFDGTLLKDKVFRDEKDPAKGKTVVLEAPTLKDAFIYKLHDHEAEYIGQTGNVEKRIQEHYKSPTSEKMAAWLKKSEKAVTVLAQFKVLQERQILVVEQEFIANMDPSKTLNTQHKAIEQEAIKTEVRIEYERFKIHDNTNKKALVIQWKEDSVFRNKEFKYTRCGYDAAMKAATEFRSELIKRFFK